MIADTIWFHACIRTMALNQDVPRYPLGPGRMSSVSLEDRGGLGVYRGGRTRRRLESTGRGS
ncbi:MAG: hypothetical protein CME02_08285 [Geminicoccus sp.]|nr:hypothetical protein [Geminicoccus sp.]